MRASRISILILYHKSSLFACRVSNIKTFDKIYPLISDKYPSREQRETRQDTIKVKEGIADVTPGDVKVTAYRYKNHEANQILTLEANRFNFSRSRPYISWVEFRNEAKTLWNHFVTIVSPEIINRIAVRYINNLNIPMPMKDFSEYLSAAPVVPEELPQGISSFLTRMVIEEKSVSANAIITQALDPKIPSTKTLPVVLDIDVFKHVSWVIDKDLWSALESLRNFKNKIFFNMITEELLEVYK